jgi:hypothetical protein
MVNGWWIPSNGMRGHVRKKRGGKKPFRHIFEGGRVPERHKN